jgi:hypothetical protein
VGILLLFLRYSVKNKRKPTFGRPCVLRSSSLMAKVKVMLSLCLIKHHAMNMYARLEVLLQGFLTSALGAVEWSASRSVRFALGKRAPAALSGGGGEGPLAGFGVVEEKISYCSPHPDSAVVQPVV